MKDTIRYPEHFAPVAEEEMVYLNGGGVLDNVGDAIDGAVDTATSALNVLGIVATVVGVCVLGSSYIWGIRQANAWAGRWTIWGQICPSRCPTLPAIWWLPSRWWACGP